MKQDTMTADRQWESACAAALARHDEALREDLLRTLVLPQMARLRAGNGTRWNEAGWYAALAPDRLDAFAAAHAGRAAASACEGGNWYPAETDACSGVAFRFFQHAAWLDLAAPADPATLRFAVPHVVMAEALAGLRVTVAGVPVAHTLLPLDGHAAAVEVAASALPRAPGQALRIGFSTPVAAVPAMLYPGSTDGRLLSLAVTMPTWREA